MMNKPPSLFPDLDICDAFYRAAKKSLPAVDARNAKNNEAQKAKKRSPICVRVTDDERAKLEALAGKTALSTYIRNQILDDDATQRAKRFRKKKRQPSLDHALVAKLLGMLGQSDLTNALFALLLAAEADRLELPEHAENALVDACAHVDEIRKTLIVALNMKAESA